MSQINKKYMQLMLLCCFAYLISYIGRLAYATNIQNVIETFRVTKTEAGYVSSSFFFCYGAGQFINGILCEKMNSRKVVTFSLITSSVITLIMFFMKNVYVMSVLWGLNGVLLSSLWCNLIKILTQIQAEDYVKKSVVIMSVSLPIGTVIAYGLSSFLTFLNAWRIYFVIAAVIVLAGAVFFSFSIKRVEDFVREYNQNLSLTEENQREEGVIQAQGGVSLLKFLSLAIIPIFLISVFSNFIRDGVTNWMPTFLNENYKTPTYFSILVTLLVPLLGITASMIAKWVMKKTNDIFISNLIFFAFSVVMLAILALIKDLPIVIVIAFFALLSTINHSISSVLTSIFPLYYKNIIKGGRAAGVLNCFGYVGSTLSTFLLGNIVDNYGWSVFMYVILACGALSVILCVWGYFAMKKKKNTYDL